MNELADEKTIRRTALIARAEHTAARPFYSWMTMCMALLGFLSMNSARIIMKIKAVPSVFWKILSAAGQEMKP